MWCRPEVEVISEPGEYTLLDSEASPSFFDLLRPGMSPIGGGGGGRGIEPPTPPPSFLLGAAGITAADAATFSTLSHFLSFPAKCDEVRCSSVYSTEEGNMCGKTFVLNCQEVKNKII